MATADILDFDQLLRPISDEQPAGVELKEDDRLRSVYQAVKDARETARSAEKKYYQAVLLNDPDASSLERPDWRKVFDLAIDAITNHSKDLWIAAWLIEALTRLHGFAGLRDGFRLTRELVERFWDGIHPRPDEEGFATTVAQLTGLNGDDSEGALLAPIDRVPITAPGSIRPLTSSDYKQAVEIDKLDSERKQQRIENGGASLEMFEKAVNESGAAFFEESLANLEAAIDEFFRLGEALESRCGSTPDGYPAAPPTSAIRSSLVDVRERMTALARHLIEKHDSAEATATEAAGDATDAAAPSASGAGTKKGMSREEAFRQLLQVADFFRRTEPHSPVSYSLEQAVRWGKMSLPELLSELVADSATREEIFKRVGLSRPDSED